MHEVKLPWALFTTKPPLIYPISDETHDYCIGDQKMKRKVRNNISRKLLQQEKTKTKNKMSMHE